MCPTLNGHYSQTRFRVSVFLRSALSGPSDVCGWFWSSPRCASDDASEDSMVLRLWLRVVGNRRFCYGDVKQFVDVMRDFAPECACSGWRWALGFLSHQTISPRQSCRTGTPLRKAKGRRECFIERVYAVGCGCVLPTNRIVSNSSSATALRPRRSLHAVVFVVYTSKLDKAPGSFFVVSNC